jgi:phosphoglycolate phosphatase-like HAD superfamily hydrolase
MNTKIVFFDFDGVIVDTFDFCFKIVDTREYITEEEYRNRFEGNIYDAPRKLKNPDVTFDDFMHTYTPELMKCEPVAQMAEAIRDLALDYMLIIVSSTATAPIDAYLRQVGLRDSFTEILGSDVDRSKVNKINMSLSKYKVQPSDAVFITDTLGDIREGEKCGVRSIAVVGGYHPEETLKKGNPYAIAGSPAEIGKHVRAYFRKN